MKKIIFYLFLWAFALPSYAQLEQTVGLFLNTDEAYEGFTLFSGRSRDAYLIDNCGKLINHWTATSPIGLSNYVHTDGNLYRCLRTNEINGFTGGGIGGGVEILDWDSNILWKYDFGEFESYHQHHDLEVLPNGNILVLAWEWRSAAEAESMGRIAPQTLWPTIIFEVEPIDSADANFVWTWRLWDHLIQDVDSSKPSFGTVSGHPELFNINQIGSSLTSQGSDWIHCNTVEYIPEFDQIVLSAKHVSEVWVIDHSTTTEQAADHSGGNYNKGGDFLYRWGNSSNFGVPGDTILVQQHDVSWIPLDHPTDPGKFMIFNNGQSGRLDMWTPPMNADGSYTMLPGVPTEPLSPDWSFDSGINWPIGCSSRRLPNGNTLYASNTNAIMKEINSDNELVWHYISPVSSTGPIAQGESTTNAGGQSTHYTFRAERYPLDYPGFVGKDLCPGEPIELLPWPYDCVTTTVGVEELSSVDVKLYPIPAQDYITVDTDKIFKTYSIYDINGRMLQSGIFDIIIPLDQLEIGMYTIEFQSEDEQEVALFIKE